MSTNAGEELHMTDEELSVAVAKWKALFDVAHQDVDPELRKERYLDLFDISMVRIDEEGNEQGIDEIAAVHRDWVLQDGFEFRVFRWKRTGPAAIEYYVRFSTREEDLVINSKAFFKNHKVYRVEVTELVKRHKVPGQVTATSTLLLPDLSERDLASQVFSLNASSTEKLLAPQAGMIPAVEKYELIRATLSHGNLPRFPFLQDDVISISDVHGAPYADGAHFSYSKKVVLQNKLLLFDHEGNAVAMCLHDKAKFVKAFIIYGTKPVSVGEGPEAKEDTDKGTVEFYPWFRVKMDTSDDGMFFVYVWTKNDFEPFLKLLPPDDGSKEVLIVMRHYENEYVGLIRRGEKSSTEVIIAPGVDPAMMLCVAATVDAMGFS